MPNIGLLYWNSPRWMFMVRYVLSSFLTVICRYAFFRSSFVNCWTQAKLAKIFSIFRSGFLYTTRTGFKVTLKSPQILTDPSFFGMDTMGIAHSLCSTLLRNLHYMIRFLSTLCPSAKGTLQNFGVVDSLILIPALMPSRVPSLWLNIRLFVLNKPSTPFFSKSLQLWFLSSLISCLLTILGQRMGVLPLVKYQVLLFIIQVYGHRTYSRWYDTFTWICSEINDRVCQIHIWKMFFIRLLVYNGYSSYCIKFHGYM